MKTILSKSNRIEETVREAKICDKNFDTIRRDHLNNLQNETQLFFRSMEIKFDDFIKKINVSISNNSFLIGINKMSKKNTIS